MGKFKAGDRCKVIKNVLSPKSIGHVVEIIGAVGKNGYMTKETYNGRIMYGYASENCLELIIENCREDDSKGT